MSSIPTQIAEAIQTSHIDRHPDPLFDNAPETAAEKREPVSLQGASRRDRDDVDSGDDDEDIPYSVLRPTTRSQKLPPLPDLRFEQSYLHSISTADTWWKVALITARDQVYHTQTPVIGRLDKGLLTVPGRDAAGPGVNIQPLALRMAALESAC
jgi:hypothetical protein